MRTQNDARARSQRAGEPLGSQSPLINRIKANTSNHEFSEVITFKLTQLEKSIQERNGMKLNAILEELNILLSNDVSTYRELERFARKKLAAEQERSLSEPSGAEHSFFVGTPNVPDSEFDRKKHGAPVPVVEEAKVQYRSQQKLLANRVSFFGARKPNYSEALNGIIENVKDNMSIAQKREALSELVEIFVFNRKGNSKTIHLPSRGKTQGQKIEAATILKNFIDSNKPFTIDGLQEEVGRMTPVQRESISQGLLGDIYQGIKEAIKPVLHPTPSGH